MSLHEGPIQLSVVGRNVEPAPNILARRALYPNSGQYEQPIFARTFISDTGQTTIYEYHPDDDERQVFTVHRSDSGRLSLQIDFQMQQVVFGKQVQRSAARIFYSHQGLQEIILQPTVAPTENLSIRPLKVCISKSFDYEAWNDSTTLLLPMSRLVQSQRDKITDAESGLILFDEPVALSERSTNFRRLVLAQNNQELVLRYPRKHKFWLEKVSRIHEAEYQDFFDHNLGFSLRQIDPYV